MGDWKQKGWKMAGSLLTLAALVVAVALVNRYGWSQAGSGNSQAGRAGHKQVQAQSQQQPLVNRQTRLVLNTRYTPCNLKNSQTTALPVSLVGATRQEVASYYQGWTVTSYGRREVDLSRTVSNQCKELTTYRTVILRNHQVVVLYGKGGQYAPVETVTSVKVSQLVPGDVKRLKQGITVKGSDRAYKVIEGLTE